MSTDDGRPEPSNPAIEALRRNHWVVKVAPFVVAILSSVLAYTGGTDTAKTESAAVKDKAESGYQLTRWALEDLKLRVERLSGDLRDLEREVRRKGKRRPAAAPVAATAPPQPAPLPRDLDKALNQVQQQASEAPTK